MIVKNEAAVIDRCLDSVRPYVGAWAIVDTGSTDGTQQRVRERLRDLPGALIERPWVDFATNRNQALELARDHGDYALIIDADEILERDADARFPARLDAPGYYLSQRLDGIEFEYQSAKLLRHDAGWRWQGVLHEFPGADPTPTLARLDGLRVRSFPDGARSRRPLRDKYLDDARVLEAALAAEPGNARYAFYLAQSLRDAGENAAAIAAYERRVAMGGWAEEAWYSRFQIAVLLERLQRPANEIVDAYLIAYEARPTRAEPLCELARYLRLRGRYASAWLHAYAASEIASPADLLFIDTSVYRWRARDERAVAAFYVDRREECAALCRELLADPHLPAEQRPRIEANLALC
ncbi:glycosyltransferase [Dokdonella sp.]|uniref:glycosyltransferase n=1 Tax=Dokdonella sp. TaxID=2291710 RepID=UPI001B05CFBC|nr:glycosyltransferase [Dokdonella sp.]MBO9663665.1 glycosyltransferase [Dokdonella sp.]